jgi:hypothetical protein
MDASVVQIKSQLGLVRPSLFELISALDLQITNF